MSWILAALAGITSCIASADRACVPPEVPPRQDATATVDGHLSLMADVLPTRDVTELRPELRVEMTSARGPAGLRASFDALAQALVADRDGSVNDARISVRDVWVELAGERADLRAGYGRIAWGRLDEVQPSDVINPVDAAKFLLEGRVAARLAVPFLRGRLFASDALTIEGIIVPRFRRGTFDELDEESSPFNLIPDAIPPGLAVSPRVRQIAPEFRAENVSGGGRLSATIGRVDVAVAAFRGFDAFGIVQLEPAATLAGVELAERHPRFTMIAGDFETVIGDWALRGEVAAFTDKRLASLTRPGGVAGHALDAGVGFDRSAGDFRIFGTVLLSREWSAADPRIESTNVSLVGSIERQFGRERYKVRAFAVVNPGDASSFVRGLFTWSVRDNVAVEASAAAFLGTGDDAISRFRGRDFLFTRLRLHF